MKKKRKQKIRWDRIFLLFGVPIIIIGIIIAFFTQTQERIHFEKRAVWVSYLNMEALKDKEESVFIDTFETMCDKAKDNKLNTIIVHVRPFMDAMYPSNMFSTSFYLTSKQKYTYDPLETMINIAHKKELQFEAWINPYRIANSSEHLEYFKEYSPIANWIKTNKILSNESNAILNPANKEARRYIVEGVKEIIDYYDVDGIHFDDYFYPPSLFANTTQEDRQSYVNELIRDVYKVIKNKDDKISFGISPQGNLENSRNIGADIDTWLSEDGYVDYVMPQIYWTDQWGMDGSITMFSDRVNAYNALHTNQNVKMYAGLAMYLCNQDIRDDAGWKMTQDNFAQQVKKLSDVHWQGYSLFDYDSLIGDFSKVERENLLKVLK